MVEKCCAACGHIEYLPEGGHLCWSCLQKSKDASLEEVVEVDDSLIKQQKKEGKE